MRKLFIPVLFFIFSFNIYGKQVLRVVYFSKGITEGIYTDISNELPGITIKGIPESPSGVPDLLMYYKQIKHNYLSFKYEKALKISQEAVSFVTKNLKNIKKWDILEKIIKMQMVLAFGLRKDVDIDQAIWNYNRWFYYDKFKGKTVPPDLYLQWKSIHNKTVLYQLNFNIPVTGVTVQIDGKIYENPVKILLPQGLHRIYWYTAYQSGLAVKEIFGNDEYTVDLFPVSLSKIKETILNDSWCSEKFLSLFSGYSGDEYLLFVSRKDIRPRFVFIDTELPGVIAEGDRSIIETIKEVFQNSEDMDYNEPEICRWHIVPFYKKWWFYTGVVTLLGGSGYAIHNVYEKNIRNNTGLIISW